MSELSYRNRAIRIAGNKLWLSRTGHPRDFDISRCDADGATLVILPQPVRRVAVLDAERLLIEMENNEDYICWGDPTEGHIHPCPLVNTPD